MLENIRSWYEVGSYSKFIKQCLKAMTSSMYLQYKQSHVIFKFLCPFDWSPLSSLEILITLNFPQMSKAYFVQKHSHLIGTQSAEKSQFWWQSLPSFLTGTLCCCWNDTIFNPPIAVYSAVMLRWTGSSASFRGLLLTWILAHTSVVGRIQNGFQKS